MAIVINGSGTVTGLAVGGLPDGTVDDGTVASGIASSKLTGALPAISGASLTGLVAGTGAFSATYTDNNGWLSIADNTILGFNNDSAADSFDTDGNYSTSTYKYTAPATGVYLFWMSIYTADSDIANGFTFLKNTSQINLAPSASNHIAYGQNADDKLLNGTVVLPLASGDTIAVQTSSGSDVHKGNSKWGGCRLA